MADCSCEHLLCANCGKSHFPQCGDVLRSEQSSVHKRIAELEAENKSIMDDYGIEGDESVRDIIERTTAAAVRLKDKLGRRDR